jgi:hypothetical protein
VRSILCGCSLAGVRHRDREPIRKNSVARANGVSKSIKLVWLRKRRVSMIEQKSDDLRFHTATSGNLREGTSR